VIRVVKGGKKKSDINRWIKIPGRCSKTPTVSQLVSDVGGRKGEMKVRLPSGKKIHKSRGERSSQIKTFIRDTEKLMSRTGAFVGKVNVKKKRGVSLSGRSLEVKPCRTAGHQEDGSWGRGVSNEVFSEEKGELPELGGNGDDRGGGAGRKREVGRGKHCRCARF